MRTKVLCGVLVAAATLATGAVAAPPPPPLDTFDSQLCSFPLKIHTDNRTRPVQLDGKATLIVGPTAVTLTNLATGRQATLRWAGPVVLGNDGTTTLLGKQVVQYGEALLPLEALEGLTSLDPNFFIIRRLGPRAAIDPCALVGGPGPAARTTPAPWPAMQDALAGMQLAGLAPLLGNLLEHIHVHLDVLVNGAPITVPQGIGIVEPVAIPGGGGSETGVFSNVGGYSPIHTHTPDGILHVEADMPKLFTLGQFFDVWQVRLTRTCLGAYCNGGGKSLRVYENGVLQTGDPRALVLRPAAEVAVTYGASGVPAVVPSSYTFPPGFEQIGFPG